MKHLTPPLISMIIPVHNAEETLVACMESCLHQTWKNIEIVVVDDGSVDASWQIVQTLAASDSRILACQQKQQGVTVARNHGMQKATGEYLFFLDADDVLPERALNSLRERAEETGADITAGTTIHMEETGAVITSMRYIPFTILSGPDWLQTIRKTWQGHIWGLLVKRSLFSPPLYCPHKLKIGEDLLQVIQLSMRCNKIAMTEETVYHYIRRGNSAINARRLPTSLDDCDEGLLIQAVLQLLNNKNITPSIRTECRMLLLFCIFNLPQSDYRRQLLHQYRGMLLSYLLGDWRIISELWKMSPRAHAGMILDCIK